MDDGDIDSFVFFFEVKFGKLVCDGRNRSFDEVFECIKLQWNQIAEKTKELYGGLNANLSNERPKFKCQKLYQAFQDRLNRLSFQLIDENLRGEDVFKWTNSVVDWKDCDKELKLKHEEDALNIIKAFIGKEICKFCLRGFQNAKLHLLRQHPEKLYQDQICVKCREKFKSPEQLFEHIVKENSESLLTPKFKKSSKKTPVIAKQFCSECRCHFDTLAKFKYHRLKAHGKWQGTLKCQYCEKTYGTVSNLRKHERKAHQKTPLKTCTECDYKTDDSSLLKIHLRIHSGEKPFACNRCAYASIKKSDLTKHIKRCQGINHKCDKCGQSFRFRKRLAEHLSWSDGCGSIREKVGFDVPSKSKMVRLNTEHSYVVGVNCQEMADEKVFVKKKKKVRCGLCAGCELTENCGNCNPCLKKTTRTLCDLRRCSDLVTQYDVVKGQENDAKLVIDALTGANIENDFDIDVE